MSEGRKFPTQAYVFGSAQDATLTNRFLDLLLQHHVRVHELDRTVTLDKQTFEKGKAYVVPTAQPQYRTASSTPCLRS